MKIFNWVHRKLNGQQPSSSVSLHQHKGEVKLSHFKVQREEKLMTKSAGDDHVDTEALLGWREGLLAIGTLGLYTDNNRSHPDDDFIMNPNFSSFPDERNSVFDYPNEEYCFDATMLIEQMLVEAEDDENPLLVYNNNNHEINKEEETAELEQQVAVDIRNKESGGVLKAAGDRTTLADLFKAETTAAAVSQKCTVGVSILKENEEILCKQKKKFPNSISGKLVKKLIPSHDANPVKKINHMMRKMMKRKIHPELRLRQKSATGILLENNVNEIQANEGMALLLQSEQLVLIN